MYFIVTSTETCMSDIHVIDDVANVVHLKYMNIIWNNTKAVTIIIKNFTEKSDKHIKCDLHSVFYC